MRSRHPSHQLLEEMDSLFGSDYPPGVVKVPGFGDSFFFPWTGFFPGQAGVWQGTPPEENIELENAPMPTGKVMILGHNWHCEGEYQKYAKKPQGDLRDATSRNLLKLLREAGIRPEDCFFTNFFVCLKAGNKGTGSLSTTPDFEEKCRRFFLIQLRVVQPKLVIVLGKETLPQLAKMGVTAWDKAKGKTFREIDTEEKALVGNFRFNGVPEPLVMVLLVHPSYRLQNMKHRHWKGKTGNDAEVALLEDAISVARLR